tara:strand:+ start:559 stop:720 length:162 start_codon:yes stop_codon:yes gene_type:complete
MSLKFVKENSLKGLSPNFLFEILKAISLLLVLKIVQLTCLSKLSSKVPLPEYA